LSGDTGSAGRPWDVGALPFVYAPLKAPTNGPDLPDLLPFALDVDSQSGVLVQVPNEAVTCAVEKAYLRGSTIAGTMDSEGIGKQYAEDFLSFLEHHSGRTSFHDAKILEIGCGTGYLLHRLKLLGADVLGIEPGDHGQEGSKRYHIRIIRDFFPSAAIRGKFDLILAYGVLEHVQSSRDFLHHIAAHLNDGGQIAISVPDCEPYIRSGDVSMLLHEHWNYYTGTTLRNFIAQNVNVGVQVQRSQFGGALYAATDKRHPVETTERMGIDHRTDVLADYRLAVERAIGRLVSYFEDAARKRESVGVFVPGRAINALAMMRRRIDPSSIRFFDDNRILHGTYFPGFDIRIEGREELISSPTDRILVMSHAFGTQIAEELRSATHNRSAFTTWEDIFAN